MKTSRILWLWLLPLLAQAAPLFAQDVPEGTVTQNKITVAAGIGMAGQEIRLPVYLSTLADVKVNHLAMETAFPSPPLSFIKVESGYLADEAGAQVSAEMVDGVIQTTVAIPEGKNGSLPQGLIIFFAFQLAEDAPAGPLTIVTRKIEFKDAQGQAVDAAVESETAISVIPKEMTPLFACFFYMH